MPGIAEITPSFGSKFSCTEFQHRPRAVGTGVATGKLREGNVVIATSEHEAELANTKPKGGTMIWILFLGTLAISLVATARVKSVYIRFARVPASSGMSGAEVAHEILRM